MNCYALGASGSQKLEIELTVVWPENICFCSLMFRYMMLKVKWLVYNVFQQRCRYLLVAGLLERCFINYSILSKKRIKELTCQASQPPGVNE